MVVGGEQNNISGNATTDEWCEIVTITSHTISKFFFGWKKAFDF